MSEREEHYPFINGDIITAKCATETTAGLPVAAGTKALVLAAYKQGGEMLVMSGEQLYAVGGDRIMDWVLVAQGTF